MRNIVKRPYRNLADFMNVYQFMIDNYTIDWANGVPAPFFEYAQVLFWTDRKQTHRNAIWEDDGEIVGFCFYESQIGSAFFSLNDEYDEIIPEMISHAEQRLSNDDGSLELKLFASQKNVISIAQSMGYKKIRQFDECIYDFSNGALDYKLPEGFYFEEFENHDEKKLIEATWRGFDHDTEPEAGVESGYHMMAAPHATTELNVIIKNADNEYVCYAGMWMTPENHLAYLEPLCTVPEYRKKGLASAALSELYRRTLPIGATHMTGGSNKFYHDIGFKPIVTWTTWTK